MDHSLHDSEKIVILSKLGFTFRIIVHFITCNSCFGSQEKHMLREERKNLQMTEMTEQ